MWWLFLTPPDHEWAETPNLTCGNCMAWGLFRKQPSGILRLTYVVNECALASCTVPDFALRSLMEQAMVDQLLTEIEVEIG